MRAKVLVVHLVDSADILSDLEKAASGIKNCLEVVSIPDRSIDLVPQAVADRQTWFDLPVVLGVEAHRVLGDMAVRIAETAISQIGLAQKQLLNIILYR